MNDDRNVHDVRKYRVLIYGKETNIRISEKVASEKLQTMQILSDDFSS